MFGWKGKLLRVDLTTGTISDELIDQQTAKNYIGGRGLGIYYLNKEVDPTIDPLSPANIIVMATGPLTGTRTPTGARYMIMTKSPLTGAITCSNSGGSFPTEMKLSGYDGIIFSGKSQRPVYLWVDRGRAELRSAEHLWGKTTNETTDLLQEETNAGARVSCIGPAGENGVLFAAIMNDKHRAAGRSGVGAVMGAKNLKAVVVHGDEKIELADEAGFKKLNAEFAATFKEATKDNPPPLRVHGTAVTAMATQNLGVLPTKNWQQGTFDEGWEDIYGVTLTEKYLVKNSFCFACPIGCGRRTKV
ncbi:MAG: aldehyde ferredoxin oxidoreductase N-terminal domain-containing protein, partial [Desulforhopalus sp.]